MAQIKLLWENWGYEGVLSEARLDGCYCLTSTPSHRLQQAIWGKHKLATRLSVSVLCHGKISPSGTIQRITKEVNIVNTTFLPRNNIAKALFFNHVLNTSQNVHFSIKVFWCCERLGGEVVDVLPLSPKICKGRTRISLYVIKKEKKKNANDSHFFKGSTEYQLLIRNQEVWVWAYS